MIGDVEGKVAVIIDDIIDTAGTLVAGAQALKDAGATKVYACATHGLFNGAGARADRRERDRRARRHRHRPARPARAAGQHPGALDRGHPRRDDLERVLRRLGVGDLRRREPALLADGFAALCARLGALAAVPLGVHELEATCGGCCPASTWHGVRRAASLSSASSIRASGRTTLSIARALPTGCIGGVAGRCAVDQLSASRTMLRRISVGRRTELRGLRTRRLDSTPDALGRAAMCARVGD